MDPKLKEGLTKELITLRSLINSLTKMSALIEVLITRIESLTIVGATVKDLMVIKAIVKDLRGYASSIPELSIIIEDIDDKVNDLISETKGEFHSTGIINQEVSEEVKKIIDEANAIASAKLSSINV